MGFLSWLKSRFASKAAPEDEDPVAAFDRRLQTLAERAGEMRKSAATLLAARGELDRGIEAAREAEKHARARIVDAAGKPDVAAVLEADAERAAKRAESLAKDRERFDGEAAALAESVAKVEEEAEVLRRERAAAQARWTASRTVAQASSRAIENNFGEMAALERARDEVERAHALAEVCREDLERQRKAKK